MTEMRRRYSSNRPPVPWKQKNSNSRGPVNTFLHTLALALLVLIASTLGGCASTTTVQLVPSPQAPLCERSANARILWAPHWRPDQKDVPAREGAAAKAIAQFFSESGCFSLAVVQRLADTSAAAIEAAVAEARTRDERVVTITVRELGPIVKIGTTLALVEGATEVVVELSEYRPPDAVPRRTFTVQWRSGGAGIVKGVASLPQDMQAALSAAMQPLKR